MIATCSLGLSLSLEPKSPGPSKIAAAQAMDRLAKLPADGIFRLAWRRLHQDVGVRAADVAVLFLEQALARSSAEDRSVFAQTLAALREARAAGCPWKALHRLDVLTGVVGASTLETVCCLIDECPSLPDAEGFISTAQQLAAARALLDRLLHSPAPEGRRARSRASRPRNR